MLKREENLHKTYRKLGGFMYKFSYVSFHLDKEGARDTKIMH